jgi:hypothetical protein
MDSYNILVNKKCFTTLCIDLESQADAGAAPLQTTGRAARTTCDYLCNQERDQTATARQCLRHRSVVT